MGDFLILGGRAGSDGKKGGFGLTAVLASAFPARCRFSLSPGLRPRSLYGQSSMKEASAEERERNKYSRLYRRKLPLRILIITRFSLRAPENHFYHL